MVTEIPRCTNRRTFTIEKCTRNQISEQKALIRHEIKAQNILEGCCIVAKVLTPMN